MTDPHLEGEIQRLLAEDADIAELGIDVVGEGGAVVLCGCVSTPERRALIIDRVGAAFPDLDVRDRIAIAGTDVPDGAEEVA